MEPKKNLSGGQIIFTIFYLLLWPALILFLSGDWWWVEGWIFGIWFLVFCAGVTIYLYFKDPALLMERYRKPGTGNQKGWDKLFLLLVMLAFVAWIVIIPLDAKRFRWTTGFPSWLKYMGGLLLLLSSFFLFRAFSDNTFLSPLVRIQKERQQHLITTGVYAVVRHPMYFGAALLFLGAPFLMGSYYGVAIGMIVILLISVRILGEEKMLMNEFPDYIAYKAKVKYRLIPFVW